MQQDLKLSLLAVQPGGRVVRMSVVNKAISANIGALRGLDALTHLDLRNCSRVGGTCTEIPLRFQADPFTVLRDWFVQQGTSLI